MNLGELIQLRILLEIVNQPSRDCLACLVEKGRHKAHIAHRRQRIKELEQKELEQRKVAV